MNFAADIEAVAESWASIDGKLVGFKAGRDDPVYESKAGYYEGYCVEAEELKKRMLARGFLIVPVPKENNHAPFPKN